MLAELTRRTDADHTVAILEYELHGRTGIVKPINGSSKASKYIL